MSFHLEAFGRVLGRFQEARRLPNGVELVGWQSEPEAAGLSHRGTIVLTGAGGRVLRRWSCGQITWAHGRPIVSRLGRLA